MSQITKLRYKGTSHYREISAADFKSIGVEDQNKVVWDRDDRRDRNDAKPIQEVSDAAAAWLLEHEGDSFEVVTDDETSEQEPPAVEQEFPNVVDQDALPPPPAPTKRSK